MLKVDKAELASGILVTAFGLAFLLGSLEYRMGSMVRMGPGFVPFSLGVISIVMGLALCALAVGREAALPAISWRALGAVLGSIGAFAFLLPRVGLIPTAIAAVLLSTLATPVLRPRTAVLLAVAVALGAWCVFVLLLGVSLPVFRMPFR